MDWLFDIEKTAEWLRDFGIWAVVISLALNVIISLLGVIPSIFLSGANAVVFGMVPGFFISLLGEVIGAGVTFALYRWGIRKTHKLQPDRWKWIQRVNSASRRKQFSAILLARLTPFVPSGIVTAVAAMSNILIFDFVVASLIGKAPSIAMETLIGHDFMTLNENLPRLILSIAFLALIYFILKKRK
jgi:uncharacterized membrane protein YdjX (TVP38/TMEM64 family)